MTLAVPTHLVDTMSTATASGVEAASHLLQEVTHAVSAAANGRARRLLRATGHGRSRSNLLRNLTLIGAIGAVAVIAMLVRQRMFDRNKGGVTNVSDGNPSSSPKPSTHMTSPERNGTMAVQPDEVKGRIKEAAGALTDNEDLKNEGKTDKAAASVKDGLDKVKDKIEDGVDAIKDRINKN